LTCEKEEQSTCEVGATWSTFPEDKFPEARFLVLIGGNTILGNMIGEKQTTINL